MEEQTNFSYWQQQWRTSSPTTKKRWRIFLLVLSTLWLLGTFYAYRNIGGVAIMGTGSRLLAAVVIGPLGLMWGVLTMTGVLIENGAEPSRSWLILFLFQLGWMFLVGKIAFSPPNRAVQQQREVAHQEKSQGRLTEIETAEQYPFENGIPLATVKDKKGKSVPFGLAYASSQGHILVTSPTRGGKGLNLTEVLRHWPGAAVIVDPKSEQHVRTAGWRQQNVGPIYHVPGHKVHLAGYYNFADADDVQELHDHLLQPERDKDRIFADKSLSLMMAVGRFAKARKLNPLRVLLDAADDDIHHVLAGLEQVPEAKPFVRQFTNGRAPSEINQDRFVASAYGTFTTRLFGYQKHIDTICPQSRAEVVPPEWVRQKATLYITYSLNELQGVGGVVAAILAGLMRHHQKYGRKQRLLIAIDEMAAVRLRNLEMYLATTGGSGITMLLYAQALAQLEKIYGNAGTEAILSNCAHQLWYVPNDLATARHMSALYGTTLKPSRSFSQGHRYGSPQSEQNQPSNSQQTTVSESLQERPLLSPTEVLALNKEQVMVLTERERQLRFMGWRLDPRPVLEQLPIALQPPASSTKERQHTSWLTDKATPEDITQPLPEPSNVQAANSETLIESDSAAMAQSKDEMPPKNIKKIRYQ